MCLLAELLALLGNAGEGDACSRENAIACYLSGAEGWDEAVKRLGGTFELRGIGFLANDPTEDEKEILVSGSFSATANGTTIILTEK